MLDGHWAGRVGIHHLLLPHGMVISYLLCNALPYRVDQREHIVHTEHTAWSYLTCCAMRCPTEWTSVSTSYTLHGHILPAVQCAALQSGPA